MRLTTFAAAALAVLVTAAPALASAGLPKIASLHLGPHMAAIHVDSPRAKIGTNLVTVEVTEIPAGHAVTLRFIGPEGQVVVAPLTPLRVLAGPPSDHGQEAHSSSDSHQAAAGGEHGAPGGDLSARAQVNFPASGTWKAVMAIQDAHGENMEATSSFDVVYGGPSRAYLGATGLAAGGSVLFGIIQRRRQAGRR